MVILNELEAILVNKSYKAYKPNQVMKVLNNLIWFVSWNLYVNVRVNER